MLDIKTVVQKANCWEFMGCHKEDCSAKSEVRLNGAHGGKNAGRACWVVAGTRCKGVVQGEYAQKKDNCNKCEFYLHMRGEDGMVFQNTFVLLNRLK